MNVAWSLVLAALCAPGDAASVPGGARGYYRVLPGAHRGRQPFNVVELVRAGVHDGGVAWELAVRAEEGDAAPLFRLRAVTERDPFAGAGDAGEFLRYVLQPAGVVAALEYRDVHTGKALLPAWGDFVRFFVPQPTLGVGRERGFPHTCTFLGHVLTLRWTAATEPWEEWPRVKVLALDRELLVGTGRVFKDAEGHRLPQAPERRNYTYVNWTAEDYRVMIDAGMNLFGVVPGVGELLREEPVFYRGGVELVTYPADLYRSNFTGPIMYLDEPACIMVGDATVQTTLKYFTDAAALIAARVRSEHADRLHALGRALKGAGVSLGDMVLAQPDFASWETRYETAFYQFEGGAAGFVHEGRYHLEEFNTFARASTGSDRAYTAEEMLRYHYAFMRGAARRFGGHWGTSIYGQADPAISPLAVTLAYDMGARYIWFWTSDHDHHLPWPEQLELARVLQRHARAAPRPSLFGPQPVRDTAIAVPYGYFLVLESPTNRRNAWDLWWVREMDAEKKNASSQRYRRLMRRAFEEIDRCLDAGESFDITVDDGGEITGYRKVVRLAAD